MEKQKKTDGIFHGIRVSAFKWQLLPIVLSMLALASCKNKNSAPSRAAIAAIDLKYGPVAMCGLPGNQFGSVEFEISGSEKVKSDFDLAIELLHSFEYDEAEKVFAKVIDADPGCAMAYWGVAMANYHPLWAPPTVPELKKGEKALQIARSLENKTERETYYIDAISAFYKDWNKIDHHTRSVYFEKGMEKLHNEYPGDKEAAIFYALALDASADPADKSFKNQKKAGAILTALYPGEPNHPGITHYLIHTYDYPELAALALPMARKYALIAPSSAHALHMPSHIFTRLGLWDDCIKSNLASVSSAKCYAGATGIKGHWAEELHGLDYLVYAYLQKGENGQAKKQVDYLKTIDTVSPADFKCAYAFAAIPSRYLVENRMWKDAAALQLYPANFPWRKFPWQEAIVHFTRLMGAIHTANITLANAELQRLNVIHDTLLGQQDAYKANQVQIQIKMGDAWINYEQGKVKEALELMNTAAAMEDQTSKHPVTPCEIIPARELLGDLLLQMNQPGKALQAYEDDLEKHPNRFNGVYRAGVAAQKTGKPDTAALYYKKLLTFANAAGDSRHELKEASLFLKHHQ